MLNRVLDIPALGDCLRRKEIREKARTFGLSELIPYPIEGYRIWDFYCVPNFSTDYLIGITPSEKAKRDISNIIKQVIYFQHKKRFFNKMTGPARIGYLSEIFPDACFIHVIRDPRAVVSSLMKVNFWIARGGFDQPWWQNGLGRDDMALWENKGRKPAVLAALQWRKILEGAWIELEGLGERKAKYIEVKYEDFVASPKRCMSMTFEMAGLSIYDDILKNIERIGIRNMNDKFKSNLTAEDISDVEAIAGPTAEKLGYAF